MLNLDNYLNLRAVHVIKDGKREFEYIREKENTVKVFPVGCIFKSFLSVLVGIAIHEGKIGSIEDCILDYFSHEEITDDRWYKLKIKHVLSKTTGIVWPGPQEPFPADMNEVMLLKFESEPGVYFQYKPDPQIIVYLLEKVYGMKVSIQLLDEFGQLLLNRGVINEKRLFTEEYYEQSICEFSCGGFPECNSYGLSWWLGIYSSIPFFYASGFGGQYLAVIPQKKMIISILSDMDRPHPENKKIIESALV